jgi:hypothetical protein
MTARGPESQLYAEKLQARENGIRIKKAVTGSDDPATAGASAVDISVMPR